jgi:predicted nucleic acid-binding protein
MVADGPLDEFLRRHRSVALDTSTLIYFVEKSPRYAAFCERLFGMIEAGKVKASTSTLTLLEVLVRPYELQKDDLVLKFYALLSTYPNITWVPMNLTVADQAARIRAAYRMKTPDAIQAASAILAGATGLICNDKAFRKIKELECLLIDEHAS